MRAPHKEKGSFLTKQHVLGIHMFMSVHAAFLFPYYINEYVIGGILHPLDIMPLFSINFSNIWLLFVVELITAYLSWHLGIYHHERGHYLEAVELNALNMKVITRDFVEVQIRKLRPPEQVVDRVRSLVEEKGDVKDPRRDREITQILRRHGYLTPEDKLNQRGLKRLRWELEMFLIPWGKFDGVRKTSLPLEEVYMGRISLFRGLGKAFTFFMADFRPDAPENLRVEAAGPRESGLWAKRYLLLSTLLIIGIALGAYIPGLMSSRSALFVWGLILVGKSALSNATITGLDRLLADPGKLRKFEQEEELAQKYEEEIEQKLSEGESWFNRMAKVRARMLTTRSHEVVFNNPDGTVAKLRAPWQFRNSGMGGAHTEAQYPESNVSLQESMFIPLKYTDYKEFQEITVNLQSRLQRIIENAEGSRVMGIGLEGGLAPYIRPEPMELPVQRLWRMMKQAIMECGYLPGEEVAIGLDGAMAELEKKFREVSGQQEAVGEYFAWRFTDREVILNKEDIIAIFRKAIVEDDIPIISIEDGFSEEDDQGWALLMDDFGDTRIFVVGDDNVTTNDAIVEEKCDLIRERSGKKGIINALLTKGNQIGTLTETILAMLVAYAKGLELIISHRSKSPNETMEAHLALGADAMGMKCGGGANTERLVKYDAVIGLMAKTIKKAEDQAMKRSREDLSRDKVENVEQEIDELLHELSITRLTASEVPTNAGIPTLAVEISFGVPGSERFENLWTFTGATPLGTSAGTTEAIHLVDSVIEPYMLREIGLSSREEIDQILVCIELDNTYRFKRGVAEKIADFNDPKLSELYRRALRYPREGKIKTGNNIVAYEAGQGCLNAQDYSNMVLAEAFVGKRFSDLKGLFEIDSQLLKLELEVALQRGKISADATQEQKEQIMMVKGQLGMNVILSQSLALGRLAAHMQGKELWQLVRELMTNTMARTIASYGGTNLFDVVGTHNRNVKKEVLAMDGLDEDSKNALIEHRTLSSESLARARQRIYQAEEATDIWKALEEELTFRELIVVFQVVSNRVNKQGIKTHKMLRSILPVYGKDAETVPVDPIFWFSEHLGSNIGRAFPDKLPISR
jgi:enolase